MKKRILVISILIICSVSGYFIYHHLMDSREVLLNNAFYKIELDSIHKVRHSLLKERAGKSRLQAAFLKHITHKIFPYWYGTKWDYNGTTQTPNEGSIACGYFVTTTLRDMGVPINRVKMAQCASEKMIHSLTTKKHISYLSGMSLSDFERQLVKLGNGLYIIGLENHTGFIVMNGDEHLFIHSTGWFPFKVVKDQVRESSVLSNSKYRVVGKISDDEAFLKRWVEAD